MAPASEIVDAGVGDLNAMAAPIGMEQPITIAAAKSHAFRSSWSLSIRSGVLAA